MRNILVNIKVSDILQSISDGGQVFLCHHSCWLMRDSLEKLPDYKEFRDNCITEGYNEHRIPFIFYSLQQQKLYNEHVDLPVLSYQLFDFLNPWIRILTGVDSSDHILSFSHEAELALFAIKESNAIEHSVTWERAFRINLLEGILRFDPDATIGFHICV